MTIRRKVVTLQCPAPQSNFTPVAATTADGFIAAIDSCGKVLAAHFPRGETNRDELPDRIYLV